MGRDNTLDKLNDCGCCEGVTKLTPHKVYNRPGMSAIMYRVGTHGQFKQTMQAHLSGSRQPALRNLTTRENDDFSIALLDGWSVVSDILTFYQERLANEFYLKTATERLSVLESARLIGYELNPGVAANAYLAFTVEDTPGAFGEALVPGKKLNDLPTPPPIIIDAGIKAQSIPGPDEQAQTYETVEKIEARTEWNAFKPRLTRPQDIAIYNNNLYLIDREGLIPTNSDEVEELVIEDLYLASEDITFDKEVSTIPAYKLDQIFLNGLNHNLKAGESLLFVGRKGENEVSTVVKRIVRVEIESDLGRTRVDFTSIPKLPVVRFETINKYTKSLNAQFTKKEFTNNKFVNFSSKNVKSSILNKTWGEGELNAFLKINRWSAVKLLQNINNKLQPKLTLPDQGLFAFRQQVGFFGHNAPHYNSLAEENRIYLGVVPLISSAYPHNWDEIMGWRIWYDPLKKRYYPDADVYLERKVSDIAVNSWALFQTSDGKVVPFQVDNVTEKSVVGFGLSAKATGLTLRNVNGAELNNEDKSGSFTVRKTTAHVQSETLELADLPIDVDIMQGRTTLMLNNMVLGLKEGQKLILSGERSDLKGVRESEALFLTHIVHKNGYTILGFENGLKHTYVRESVTINGNVSLATHGETVQEVLGSGDASQSFQRFVLRQPPLTYISASTPGGSKTTLEIRVNDILWKEEPSFYGHGPEERIYITRIDDDGKTTVIFGDGKRGTRIPTGQENIKAKYRKGIGLQGLVKADQISQLMTQPLGVKGVTNPIPSSDADDRERLANARLNAPVTVLTLDRVVSLKDYEDFASSFAGIDKALATWSWNGLRRTVFITVAGPEGAEVEKTLRDKLSGAMYKYGNPFVSIAIKSYKPIFFTLKAKIEVHPEYLTEKVLEGVRETLRENFSFEKRQFGQPVYFSEVVDVIHHVNGVKAVDLDELGRIDKPKYYHSKRRRMNRLEFSKIVKRYKMVEQGLEAALPRIEDGNFIAAELLTLDARPIELEEIQ